MLYRTETNNNWKSSLQLKVIDEELNHKMKRKLSRRGFELESPNQFLTTITIKEHKRSIFKLVLKKKFQKDLSIYRVER